MQVWCENSMRRSVLSRKLYKKILKGFSSVLDRIKFFFYHLQKISTLSIKIIFMTVINQGYYCFFLLFVIDPKAYTKTIPFFMNKVLDWMCIKTLDDFVSNRTYKNSTVLNGWFQFIKILESALLIIVFNSWGAVDMFLRYLFLFSSS